MHVALIAALAENRVIGRDNRLPWHLPGDLQYFKAITLGKPVVMGRKTWESLGRALPGRTNIVITRQNDYSIAGAPMNVKVVTTLEAALALAKEIAERDGVEECMVIGGADIYAQALPRCDRLYLTEVHAHVEGDAHFPEFDRRHWREVKRDHFAATETSPWDYSLVIYERC